MVMNILSELGPWTWWIVGLALLGLEILMPGTFFLWFGLSAMVVGTVSLALGPDSTFWVWQMQVFTFVLLSLLSAYFGRKAVAHYGWDKSDNDMLNERGAQLIGRTAVLTDPISQGNGRVKLGDTIWRVQGPELDAGTKVKVVGYDAGTLMVEQG